MTKETHFPGPDVSYLLVLHENLLDVECMHGHFYSLPARVNNANIRTHFLDAFK